MNRQFTWQTRALVICAMILVALQSAALGQHTAQEKAAKIDEVMTAAHKYRLFNGSCIGGREWQGDLQKRPRPGKHGMEYSQYTRNQISARLDHQAVYRRRSFCNWSSKERLSSTAKFRIICRPIAKTLARKLPSINCSTTRPAFPAIRACPAFLMM